MRFRKVLFWPGGQVPAQERQLSYVSVDPNVGEDAGATQLVSMQCNAWRRATPVSSFVKHAKAHTGYFLLQHWF